MGDKTGGESTGFAARLKRLREAAGLSQAQLADRAGMNVFGVAKLEQGQREPSWSTVLSLSAALGVDCTAFAAAPDSASEEPTPKEPEPAAAPAKKPAVKKKPRGEKK